MITQRPVFDQPHICTGCDLQNEDERYYRARA